MDFPYIKDIAQKVFAQTPVRRVYLFGSTARNENSASSDLDFLVELDKTKIIGLVEFIRIQMALEEAFHKKVDLITEDSLSPHLAPFINQDKKLIYEA